MEFVADSHRITIELSDGASFQEQSSIVNGVWTVLRFEEDDDACMKYLLSSLTHGKHFTMFREAHVSLERSAVFSGRG